MSGLSGAVPEPVRLLSSGHRAELTPALPEPLVSLAALGLGQGWVAVSPTKLSTSSRPLLLCSDPTPSYTPSSAVLSRKLVRGRFPKGLVPAPRTV